MGYKDGQVKEEALVTWQSIELKRQYKRRTIQHCTLLRKHEKNSTRLQRDWKLQELYELLLEEGSKLNTEPWNIAREISVANIFSSAH